MSEFEPKQFGKYYLLEKLAVGGMAEIYKAKTFGVDGFEKELAIKRILPHCSADKDFITMLTDEAKLSVLLSHANIVQVYDLGKVGDDYFISMEFIHGINLRDVLYTCRENKKPMPTELAVYIASEISKGLDYAHRKTDTHNQPLNIIHRDVSPQNVLISFEGEVKMVDFGIAKAAMNISHTMAGILKGKIAYMSPEQAMGKPIDRRTDIFSTGILLYEMLTGTKLFTGESQFEVLKKIRTTKITINRLPEAIPAALRPVVAKVLAYNPEDRYQFCGDLQMDLTKFLYSTYHDFSPRKLGSFLKELFAKEIGHEKQPASPATIHEQKTSSMNMSEGARQQEIVHREPSYQKFENTLKSKGQKASLIDTLGGRDRQTAKTPMSKVPTEYSEITAKRGKSGIYAALITIFLIAIMAASAFTFIPSIRFWERALPKVIPLSPENAPVIEQNGSISIITEPSGATILVDNKLTGLTTPATLEQLPIDKDLKITISKPGYEDVEQIVNLHSTQPQKITTSLKSITTTDTTGNIPPLQDNQTQATSDKDKKPPQTGEKPTTQVVPPTDIKTTKDETPAKTQIEQGSLKITSRPDGAKIFLDNRATNLKTPATLGSLKVGVTYNIRVDMDGYKSVTKRKTISKDSESFSFELEKIDTKKTIADTKPAGTITPVIPADTVNKDKEKDKNKPKEAGIPGVAGTLRVSSTPSGADVYIGGDHKGTTPLNVSVPSGSVSVVVNKEGFAKTSKQVDVKPNGSSSVNVKLLELYGIVSVTSEPSKASVTLDGQSIPAQTPVNIRKVRTDKSHTITVTLTGFKTWSSSFTMSENTKSLHVTLQKEE